MEGEKGLSIIDWMEIFKGIYGKNDENKTPEQILIAMSAHCSSIGESIRKYHFPELMEEAAHSFCWVCTFINKCQSLKGDVFSFSGSLSDIISFKYPDECGHCGARPCRCDPSDIDKKKDKAAEYKKLLRKKIMCEEVKHIDFNTYSFEDWQKILGDVYRPTVHVLSLENIGFHFLEEVGEESKAVRQLSQLSGVINHVKGIDEQFLNELSTLKGVVEKYEEFDVDNCDIDSTSTGSDMIKIRLIKAKMDMIVELADIFSWFCSILNKINNIYEISGFGLKPLEDELLSKYSDGTGKYICVACREAECKCIFLPKLIIEEDR